MPRPLPDELLRIAERQSGVLSRAQILGAGVTHDFIRAQRSAGRWRRIHPGVYATSNAELTRTAEIWAALLYAGEGAIASHETAAELWGLTNEPAAPDAPVMMTVPPGRQLARRAGVQVFRSRMAVQRRHPARLPPVSRIEDTVLDLADRATSLDAVLAWVTRACQRRLTQPQRLAAALAVRGRARWRRELEETLADIADGADSPLEITYLRRVERAHGLPNGERQQHRIVGRQSQWIDVRYRDYRLIVELDGRDNHSTVEEACDTLRYGWADVASRACAGQAVHNQCVSSWVP